MKSLAKKKIFTNSNTSNDGVSCLGWCEKNPGPLTNQNIFIRDNLLKNVNIQCGYACGEWRFGRLWFVTYLWKQYFNMNQDTWSSWISDYRWIIGIKGVYPTHELCVLSSRSWKDAPRVARDWSWSWYIRTKGIFSGHLVRPQFV